MTSLEELDSLFAQGEYAQIAEFCQENFEETGKVTFVWLLGIAQLLEGNEETAQLAWMSQLYEASDEQVEQWSLDIFRLLNKEAIRQEEQDSLEHAWLLRCHAQQFNESDLQNKLEAFRLSHQLNLLTADFYQSLELSKTLSELSESIEINVLEDYRETLIETLKISLQQFPLLDLTYELSEICARIFTSDSLFLDTILDASLTIYYAHRLPLRALRLLDLCYSYRPDHLDLLRLIITVKISIGDFDAAISLAKSSCELSKTLVENVVCSYILIKTYIQSGSAWDAAQEEAKNYKQFLSKLLNNSDSALRKASVSWLFSGGFVLPYLEDSPESNRDYINAIGSFCKREMDHFNPPQSIEINPSNRLRIGYLSSCLRRHSVGWLARSLFNNRDHEKFEIFTYFVNALERSDPIQDWYEQSSDTAHRFGLDSANQISNQIMQDKIDILIDLDSITFDISCEVLCSRPAPIQATWLGWDASGIPSIDYYIADPYVLPEDADSYYSEKIFRLPSTYVAIDGFEVAPPTLSRKSLGLEKDSILYFSAQNGMKRNPEMLKLQLEIIKAVPNSYFLIKGLGATEMLKQYITDIAKDMDIAREKIIFLGIDSSSEIHRGNLSVSDIVLDTYPYNGATTTMEALWMERPIVTKVGQQFSARNSYTMLKNAGVKEGIAWSNEEYVDWGIRLGLDKELRDDIAWKLKQSKRSAPLWNARQFTQDMESAYLAMWQSHSNSKSL